MCAPNVVGSADGFRARRTAGETRETPRTAHAPVAQLAKEGFHNRRRQDQALRPAFPFLRPATRGGWLLVGALSRFGRECTDHTRGGTLSLPPSFLSPFTRTLVLSLSLQLDVFVCL